MAAADQKLFAICTQVSGLCVRVERYAEQDAHASRLAVSVHDFEVGVAWLPVQRHYRP